MSVWKIKDRQLSVKFGAKIAEKGDSKKQNLMKKVCLHNSAACLIIFRTSYGTFLWKKCHWYMVIPCLVAAPLSTQYPDFPLTYSHTIQNSGISVFDPLQWWRFSTTLFYWAYPALWKSYLLHRMYFVLKILQRHFRYLDIASVPWER